MAMENHPLTPTHSPSNADPLRYPYTHTQTSRPHTDSHTHTHTHGQPLTHAHTHTDTFRPSKPAHTPAHLQTLTHTPTAYPQGNKSSRSISTARVMMKRLRTLMRRRTPRRRSLGTTMTMLTRREMSTCRCVVRVDVR